MKFRKYKVRDFRSAFLLKYLLFFKNISYAFFNKSVSYIIQDIEEFFLFFSLLSD